MYEQRLQKYRSIIVIIMIILFILFMCIIIPFVSYADMSYLTLEYGK